MAEHGGYREPANPAPVSGPGAHSQRTDGGPSQVMSTVPDQPYGQQSADLDAQRVAPMAGAQPLPSMPSAPAPGGAGPQGGGMDFAGPSQRPNEPITSGTDIGPGPGSNALTFQPVNPARGTGQMTALLTRLSATDTTGIMGQLLLKAQAAGA